MENNPNAGELLSPCIIRARDIALGRDETYNRTIVPYVLDGISAIGKPHLQRVLDAGCGCGFLTDKLDMLSENYQVHGIDISQECIQYATENYAHTTFEHCSIYEHQSSISYDICVATMVVHLLPNYDLFLTKMSELLRTKGSLLLVLPHPNYWPAEKLSAFEYTNERAYKYDFRINGSDKYWEIDYYHRTIQTYVNRALSHNFHLCALDELFEKKHGKTSSTPHLLGLKFTLSKDVTSAIQ